MRKMRPVKRRGSEEIIMDIFSLFTLCGGLAFFLYGMTTMSKSLEKMAGGRLEDRKSVV